jgi:hypothetical protein
MEETPRLDHALQELLGQYCYPRDQRLLYGLVWMVVGFIRSGKVSLTAWIDYVPTSAVYAQSTQRRFSRWLRNERVPEHSMYEGLIRYALSHWTQNRLVLALDTTRLWDQYCIIRIVVVYRGRGIPIAWKVLEHASSTVAYSVYAPLLETVVGRLPAGVEVLFLADRGFADVELFKHLHRLGWHYRIRVKSNFLVYRGKQGTPVGFYTLSTSHALFLQHVHITKARYGLVHLALAHHYPSRERWSVVSDQPTSVETFVEYGLRFSIEENFLDDKSNGFQLESSHIRSAPMLSRLCLVLAIATLYLTSIGTTVVEQGNRRQVDPHWFRGNSYFKIGWHWLRKALVQGWNLPTTLELKSALDPAACIASLSQAVNRKPLYFKCTTVDCAIPLEQRLSTA